jgi:hypothetical protein
LTGELPGVVRNVQSPGRTPDVSLAFRHRDSFGDALRVGSLKAASRRLKPLGGWKEGTAKLPHPTLDSLLLTDL